MERPIELKARKGGLVVIDQADIFEIRQEEDGSATVIRKGKLGLYNKLRTGEEFGAVLQRLCAMQQGKA